MSTFLSWTALGFYALAIASSLPSVIRRRQRLTATTLAAVGAGLLSHFVALGLATASQHRLPFADVGSATSLLAFLVGLAFLASYAKYRIMTLGIFILPLMFVLTLGSLLQGEADFESAQFRTRWLIVHTSSLFVGYAALFVTFVASLMYLIQERELKSKKPRAFYYRLPSLEILDELAYKTLILGLPFVTLGIVSGFLWASQTWKGLWGLDPKIVASVMTWAVYMVIFFARLAGRLHGRRAAILALVGFAALIFTFLGITYASSVHGYFPTQEGSLGSPGGPGLG